MARNPGKSASRRQLACSAPERLLRYFIGVMLLVMIVFAIVLESPQSSSSRIVSARPGIAITAYDVPSPLPVTFALAPRTLNELLALPADQLGKVDIARINLLCATGLPGAEKLDVEHALATLDQWAQRVAFETERHLYRITDPRYAEHYQHSEAYFRAEMLMQVLYQDLGVKYDMETVGNFSFKDSRVAFIHGMIDDANGGTCASMPVMYVAIGRRLGYPLKLVTTEGHVFVRWEGTEHSNPDFRGRGRFNIETTSGFMGYPDDYYKTWPFKLTDEQVRTNGHLLSLSPSEEFAQFLASRGHCAIDNDLTGFAARCYENAYRYDTLRPCYAAWCVDAAARSDYQPFTPALIGLLAQHGHGLIIRRPFDDDFPTPDYFTGPRPPNAPLTPGMGIQPPQPRAPGMPQPMMPGISQPIAPMGQPVIPPFPQEPPFRSPP
ncbi:MAG: transglutaminase family protein [Phycisphaeraceae bacterium]